jgi:hypothetical protein
MAKTRRLLMLYDCDRCNFTFKKKDLRKQRGMHLCDGCYDTVLEIDPINIKWRSSRDNSTSIDPVTTPIIFNVSTSITVGRSQTKTREGSNDAYEMYVVGSGGPVTSISAMPGGTFLVLIGTSDTNRVSIVTNASLDIRDGGGVLCDGSTMMLVYNSITSKWIETSRQNVLPYVVAAAPSGPSLYSEDFAYNTDVAYTGA